MKTIIISFVIIYFLCGYLSAQTAKDYYKRGNEKSKIGRYKEAILEYDKSIKINSSIGSAYRNRAFVYCLWLCISV